MDPSRYRSRAVSNELDLASGLLRLVGMRKPALLVTVLAAGLLAPWVSRADVGARLRPDPDRAEEGSKMRRHGQAASILGIIQLTAGSALGIAAMVMATRCSHEPGCRDEGGSFSLIVPGAVFTASGAIAATAGIPMWVYGARQERSVSVSASGLRVTF